MPGAGLGDIDWRQVRASGKPITREQGEALRGLPHVGYVSVEAWREAAWSGRPPDRATQARPSRSAAACPDYEHANGVTSPQGRFFADDRRAPGPAGGGARRRRGRPALPGTGPGGPGGADPRRLVHGDRGGPAAWARSWRRVQGRLRLPALDRLRGRHRQAARHHSSPWARPRRGRQQARQDEVIARLRRARGVRPYEENDFEIFTNDTLTEPWTTWPAVVGAATFGVCALALLVGGIGIMNIMLVSVTERTREIGVRMALGARRRRILAQFVIEAVTLSPLGGVLGRAAGRRRGHRSPARCGTFRRASRPGRCYSPSPPHPGPGSSSASTPRCAPAGSTRSRPCGPNRRGAAGAVDRREAQEGDPGLGHHHPRRAGIPDASSTRRSTSRRAR